MGDPDEALVARLREALYDPPPAEVVEAAKAAFALRRLDAELAALTADSLETAGAVRGPGEARLLVFETPAVSVDVQVTSVGEARRLVGQVSPPAGPAALDTGTGTSELAVDAWGRFVCEDVPPGPVRLRFPAAQPPVATAWTVV